MLLKEGIESNPEDKTIVVGSDEFSLDPMVEAVESAGFRIWAGPGSTSAHPSDCPGFYVLYTPKDDRIDKSAALLNLETYPEIKVFIALTGSILEGKNLQMCNRMFVLDIP
jgi:hypothetical protein